MLGFVDFGLENFAFDGPEARDAPTGHRHGLDEVELGFGLRVMLADEIVE